MKTLNAKQKTTVAAMGAAFATATVLHNPISGYDFTLREHRGIFEIKHEWQYTRTGCTEELQQEMQRLDGDIKDTTKTATEKYASGIFARVAEIRTQCVLVTTWEDPPPFMEPEPFWIWESRGALYQILAPMRNFIFAILIIALWGAVTLFAFRSSSRAEDITRP